LERYDDRVSYNPNEWYMEVLLEVIEGPFKGAVFSVDEANAFTFGRAADCTLAVVDDDTIAPLHFQIRVEQPVAWLRVFEGDSGVFFRYSLHRWRYFNYPVSSTIDDPDTWENTMLLHTDTFFLRAGDHKFRLEIERAPVCIDCGINFDTEMKAPSCEVGFVGLCTPCWILEPTAFEDSWLETIDDLEVRYLFDSQELHEPFRDFVLAKKARHIWLKGFHNNKDYVRVKTRKALDDYVQQIKEEASEIEEMWPLLIDEEDADQ